MSSLNRAPNEKELQKLEDETGLYGSLTDEEIAANAGKTYQDATALRDPLTGLSFGSDITQESEEDGNGER